MRANFYAIAEGEGHCIPAITTSWAIAAPMVQGPSTNVHKRFPDFQQAMNFLVRRGQSDFFFHQGPVDGPKPPRQSTRKYYAVANGRQTGVYTDYELEVKPLVDNYPRACHESFQSREEAELFVETYVQTTHTLQDRAETSSDSDESQSDNDGDVLAGALNTMSLADS